MGCKGTADAGTRSPSPPTEPRPRRHSARAERHGAATVYGAMDLALLDDRLADLGEPRFRARQVWAWTARGARALRGDDRPAGRAARAAGRRGPVLDADASSARPSARDGTVKALFRTHDGRPVEAVLMRYHDGRRSLCLSSQSGCPLTCTFCATGSMKFGRNLTAGEIVDQALHFRRVEQRRPRRLHGHGRADDEPRRRARRLRAPARPRHHAPAHGDLHRRLGPGHRRASPRPTCRSASRSRCTRPRTRCAARSCRSTTATRSPTCSPPAARFHERKRRRIFVEYVMLAGVNDRYEQALALAEAARPAASTRST